MAYIADIVSNIHEVQSFFVVEGLWNLSEQIDQGNGQV